MITKEVEEICSQYEYEGGISVLIFVPKGEEIAKKTFNPKLGIVGGISILGTSGIVEPMSEAALIRSIGVEMRQRIANGSEYLLVTPGNYGSSYLKEELKLPLAESLKCSNYVGETVDMAVDMGAKGILFDGTSWKVCKGCRRDYEYPFPFGKCKGRTDGSKRNSCRCFIRDCKADS